MDANIPGTPDPWLTTRGMERIDPHWHEPERDICFDNVQYAHEGYFDYKAFRQLLADWAKAFDYIADELFHEERVSEHGREVESKLLFQKKMSGQHFAILRMEYKITHIVDQHATIDGRDVELQHGHFHCAFNGYAMGFERWAWEGKAVYAFIHGIIDKFVYKLHRGRYADTVVNDATELVNRIKGFFDLYKHRLEDQIDTKEEEEEVKPELEKKHEPGEDEIHGGFMPFGTGSQGMP